MKLGTKIARLKRSIGSRTALDEDGLEFVLLVMPENGGRGLSLERGLSTVIYMLIIVALEHD